MPESVLQLRVELLHIEPLIWRRLQVPGDYTFWDLHVAIQNAFAWNDAHLHEFRPWRQRDGHPRFGIPQGNLDDLPPLPLCRNLQPASPSRYLTAPNRRLSRRNREQAMIRLNDGGRGAVAAAPCGVTGNVPGRRG